MRNVTRLVYVLSTAVLTLLIFGGTALAQGNAQSADVKRTFLPYMFAVYTITWLAFFAYAFYMNRRQRELRRQIDELRWGMTEKGK